MDKTAEPEASEWDQDFSNEPMDDPMAAIRFAGCSVESELIDMEAEA